MSQEAQPAAAKKDLVFEEGITYDKTRIWTKSDGSAIDLTGYTEAALHVRDVDTDELLLDLNLGNGGIILGTIGGEVTIRIQHTQLTDLNWEHAVYALRVVGPFTGDYPAGMATKLMFGDVHVEQSRVR